MGNNTSDKSSITSFNWEKIKTKPNDPILFDPRFEDIYIGNDKLLITDISDKVFIFNSIKNKNNTHKSYEIHNTINIGYNKENKNEANPLKIRKIFDQDGTSLLWIEKIGNNIYYFDLSSKKLHEFNIFKFLNKKYNNNEYKFRIATKSLINLGNGLLLFMIFLKTDNKQYCIDIIKLDIINKIEIQTISVYDINKGKLNIDGLDLDTFDVGSWGFQKCPHKNQCVILTRQFTSSIREHSYLFLISLNNGQIIYQSTYNWIRDLMFNPNGNYLCIFEKIKQGKRTFNGVPQRYVNVIIFNTNKLQNICKLSLNYAKKHLSWDSMSWINNSILFVKPYELEVVPADKLSNIEIELYQNKSKNKSFKNDSLTNIEVGHFVDLVVKNDKKIDDDDEKKLCLLSLDQKWWDLNIDTLNYMNKYTNDSNISKIIFEYSGFNWLMIEFDYYTKIEKKKKTYQSSMNEIFRSGQTKMESILLSGQLMFNPKELGTNGANIKHRINNWQFKVCIVPKNFVEISKDKNIQVVHI